MNNEINIKRINSHKVRVKKQTNFRETSRTKAKPLLVLNTTIHKFIQTKQ